LYDFLDTIKTQPIEEIKANLINAYSIIPIRELKNIKNLSTQDEIMEFIETLQKSIKKEML
jgi:hypothetical protein